MAIKVEKRVVCDVGERHAGTIRQWRVTVDGEGKVFDLCPRCSAPLEALWSKAGTPRRAPGRMQIKTMSEIEAEKQKTPTGHEG